MAALVFIALMATGACTDPPDPAIVEALTAGFWHASVDGDDYIYEFTFSDKTLGGRLHMVTDGKQMNEIPVPRVTLLGSNIGIRNGRFPSYKGEFDVARDHIVGGVPGEPRLREMNLTRVDFAEWPMVRPQEATSSDVDSYVWTHPEQRTDGWETGAPSDVGIDSSAIDRTVQAILAGDTAALHSFLVVRDGKLVVEEYFYGWDTDDLHPVLSCTKSVSSLLVGIAIDQGYLTGASLPVLDFFPGYVDQADSSWEAVRLQTHQRPTSLA